MRFSTLKLPGGEYEADKDMSMRTGVDINVDASMGVNIDMGVEKSMVLLEFIVKMCDY